MEGHRSLSLTCEGNVNNYKSVHHPIPTLACGNREHPELSFQLSAKAYFLLGQTKGEKIPFFGGCKKRSHIVIQTPEWKFKTSIARNVTLEEF